VEKALDLFAAFLRGKGLQYTKQREVILREFLKAEKHLSIEELYTIVKKKDPKLGQTTVFRTLKILCEAGIADEVDLGDRMIKYEVKLGHEHHDHLVCTKCGKCIEAVDERIEKLQSELCKRFGFLPQKHRLEIFGVCKECK
jgi:Fur family ferric uptake transcriptional regulator